MDHLLLVPLASCAMVSTAMDMLLRWVLPQRGALALEVAVEVAEEYLCLVDHLEVVVVLEDLCLMEHRLELFTILCLHAVDGDSSSALSGRAGIDTSSCYQWLWGSQRRRRTRIRDFIWTLDCSKWFKWHPLIIFCEYAAKTIHIRHLLLDHEVLPIVLVEYGMEEAGCIPSSVDLDRAGLVLPLVTVGPTMLVCAVSLTHEVVSISDFDLEIEY